MEFYSKKWKIFSGRRVDLVISALEKAILPDTYFQPVLWPVISEKILDFLRKIWSNISINECGG